MKIIQCWWTLSLIIVVEHITHLKYEGEEQAGDCVVSVACSLGLRTTCGN